MTGPLYRLGRLCAAHHRVVLAAWLVLAVGLTLASRSAGDRTTDNVTLPGTGSAQATQLLQAKLPEQAYGSNPLVMRARHGRLTDPGARPAVDDTYEALRKLPHVTRAVNPLSSEGSHFLSRDKTIGYIPVTLDVGVGDITRDQAQRVLAAAAPARKAGLQVAVGGYVGQQLSKPETGSSDVIGLAAAVMILLFAFGTATAMALPIVTAVLGLAVALSVIGLLGHVIDVPSIAPTLATMIGLGVGIDYALFLVTRHKLQLKDGMEMGESCARATATSGGAVVFAGVTVVLALCSLSLAGIPLVSNMGYAAAVSVVVAVTAAVTLLPALLGALGPRIDSLRVRLGRKHPDDIEPHGWRRWAGAVARHPCLSLDYEVFLVSQMQDHYRAERQPIKAIVDGLATTGRVITSAALIMVAVFTSFVLNGDPTVKEFGVGLAVAIAIDATIVRSLLVPAVMALMRHAAWWLPRPIDRVLPHLSIEGDGYFAESAPRMGRAPG